MNYKKIAAEQAAELLLAAYTAAVKDGVLKQADVGHPSVETPKDIQNGDFASGFAMQSARLLGLPPRQIAEAVCARLALEGSYFASAESKGPGFINFTLSRKWFADVLAAIEAEGARYGRSERARPEKIMVEFVSANPTGPMTLGNARGGVLGDTLSEVLSRAGHDVTREFYLNDAGHQVEVFAQSLEARYMQIMLGEDGFAFPDDGYHGDYVRELAAEFHAMHGGKYAQADQAERRQALVTYGLAQNIARMKVDLDRYGVGFDVWFAESSLHDGGLVDRVVQRLSERGHTYESDGALWLRTTDFGCEKDDVLRKSNGFYTYFAADIAYHYNKLHERGFDRAINIWGGDHHGHVARLKAALDALGLDGTNRLEIILMQMVRFVRDGEVVRMSKRTGKAIELGDLLDEISRDAARYFFNMRAADSHLEFDLGLAVRQDSENPVYYVQYAHARVHSILRALAQAGIDTDGAHDFALLTDPSEEELIRELARLPEEITLAADSREPSRINRYAAGVAGAFHRFYGVCRIKDAESDALRDARIALIKCTAAVLRNTLSVIGVSAPEHM